jgi:integrase
VAHVAKRRTAEGQDRWDVRWRALGRAQRKTFQRRKDADAFRRTVEAEELRGVVVDMRQSSRRFDDYATEWIATRRRPDGRALSLLTAALYRDLLRRHLMPGFGAAKIAAIQPRHVRKWYGEMADGTSPLQAAKAYRLLRAILNTAVRDGVLAANPCNIEGAGVERSLERPLVDAETVFDLADAIDDRYRALILLIAFGPGSRRGEVRAYRRRHVDLLHGRILTELQEQVTPGGLVADAPRNDSTRWTTLPPLVLDALAEHLDRYSQPVPDGFVFTGSVGGPISRPHWYKSFDRARRAVGRPELHPHDLRHAVGTLYAQQGATTREIMARLGHRSRTAADRYQHAAARRDAELAAKLQEAALAAQRRRKPRGA